MFKRKLSGVIIGVGFMFGMAGTANAGGIPTIDVANITQTTVSALKNVEAVSKQISQEKSIEKQRELFAKLTQPMYKLAKVANLNYAVYYQNCPMFNGGTNWLSKNESIKNPFYGNQMLTCGSTVETIKK